MCSASNPPAAAEKVGGSTKGLFNLPNPINMKYVSLFLLLGIAACQPDAPAPVAEDTYATFGAALTPAGAQPLPAVLADAEALAGQSVKVSGTVREVCQNKGCWLTLNADGVDPVRVTFRDYGFFVPKDLAGHEVVLEGTLQQTTVDVETLRHYAEEGGKSEDEVAAITAPKVAFSLIADGVLVPRM